jgi:MOSC domain-containing protein YiiM
VTGGGSSVVAVARDAGHHFSKAAVESITLRAGSGVEGDAHFGVTVQHRSRVRRDPTAPNLRQVHLVAAELLDELAERGFDVAPGGVGENVTTRGLDLLALPTGARLQLGADAVVEVTGLRNPCVQLDRHQRGLQRAVLDRDAAGNLIRRAGVMAVVLADGTVRAGDPIAVELPPGAPRPLAPV